MFSHGSTGAVVLQVSVLSREHEKESFRLSWGAEHLDNVVLSSSLLHSGYKHIHTDSWSKGHSADETRKELRSSHPMSSTSSNKFTDSNSY